MTSSARGIVTLRGEDAPPPLYLRGGFVRPLPGGRVEPGRLLPARL